MSIALTTRIRGAQSSLDRLNRTVTKAGTEVETILQRGVPNNESEITEYKAQLEEAVEVLRGHLERFDQHLQNIEVLVAGLSEDSVEEPDNSEPSYNQQINEKIAQWGELSDECHTKEIRANFVLQRLRRTSSAMHSSSMSLHSARSQPTDATQMSPYVCISPLTQPVTPVSPPAATPGERHPALVPLNTLQSPETPISLRDQQPLVAECSQAQFVRGQSTSFPTKDLGTTPFTPGTEGVKPTEGPSTEMNGAPSQGNPGGLNDPPPVSAAQNGCSQQNVEPEMHSSQQPAEITRMLVDQLGRMITMYETREQREQNRPFGGGSSDLPKLTFAKFDGNILQWKTFIDRFTQAVDRKTNLCPADKLTHLMQQVTGEAARCIANLSITNENYAVAMRILKNKYGDPNKLIAALYRKITDMKPVTSDPVKLISFCGELETTMQALEALGEVPTGEHLVGTILRKLPGNLKMLLEFTKPVKERWTVETLRTRLQEHVERIESSEEYFDEETRAREKAGANTSDFTGDGLLATESKLKQKKSKGNHSHPSQATPQKHPKGSPKIVQPRQEQATTSVPQRMCVFCGKQHYHDECPTYQTAEARASRLKNRCLICFRINHRRASCKSTKPCFHCKKTGSHHSALCYVKFGKKPNRNTETGHIAAEIEIEGEKMLEHYESNDEVVDETADCAAEYYEPSMGMIAANETVVMQTAQATVQNPKTGTTAQTRIFFDGGSSRTYVSAELAARMQLKTKPGPSISINTFGSKTCKTVPTLTSEIVLRLEDQTEMRIPVTIIKEITGKIWRTAVNVPEVHKLAKRLQLADTVPQESESKPMDILIGNDYLADIVTGERLSVLNGLYLLGSKLGWILSGRIQTASDEPQMGMMCQTIGTNPALASILKIEPSLEPIAQCQPKWSEMWDLETIGIKDVPLMGDDARAMDEFEKTIRFENGRYQVTFPWREHAKYELQDNYWLSLGRLKSLLKRLSEQPELMPKCAAIFDDQLKKGVIEVVNSDNETVEPSHYMPHHAVITPQKETTKVRVVFDGSAKADRKNCSLNESLLPGPVLLENLCGILMRFRHNKIVMISDIEKAFLQVGVQTIDRDKVRFLWLKDPTKPSVQDNLLVMRFSRVPFGLNCSPFLLAATMRHHLKKYPTSACAKKLLKNHYVDNCITGVNCADEAVKFYEESKTMFSECNMNLTQWITNDDSVREKIPESDRAKSTDKVLGLMYDATKDEMGIACPSGDKLNIRTKRDLLSVLGAVYDPLGLALPAMVQGRVLMQKVVLKKAKWDDELDSEFQKDLKDVKTAIDGIQTLRIPRYIGPLNRSGAKHMLICFTDASNSCFAAVVYLRTETENTVDNNLVFAKMRLNPVKQLTIPRLELLGILIGTRALNFVQSNYDITSVTKVLYTDSQCAFQWVKSAKKQETWVQNRVKEIRSSEGLILRYVPSDQNPADWATRGKQPSELTEFWWKGPQWVRQQTEKWPTWDVPEFQINNTETKQSVQEITLNATEIQVESPYGIKAEDYSTLLRILRVTATCTKFIDKMRLLPHSQELSSKDLEEAKRLWEKSSQNRYYPDIIRAVKKNRKHQMMQLGLKLNEYGVLVCHGRLAKANLPESAKMPVLLSKKDPFAVLIILECHKRTGHAGAPQTLAFLRQAYWIPAVRPIINFLIKGCQLCRRFHGIPFRQPRMPELPSARVSRQTPFSHTGIDFFGPLKVKESREVLKVYVCLFTCLTVRAVHLELVESVSTISFLNAVRRFIARRGKPTTIVSDNAPSFKLGNSVLANLWAELVVDPSVHSYCANEGISWKYITEYAPWMGGVYERVVGLVKRPLRKVLGKSCLSKMQFQTVLCEIEAIVNSRPLCYVSEDPDATIITPNHFLSLLPKNGFPSSDGVDLGLGKPDLQELFAKGNRLLEEFWKRWSDDYLLNLRSQTKYDHAVGRGANVAPEPGQVVIIKDPGLGRGKWRLGRITQIVASHDGVIRSAQVKLPNGRVVGRPIRLLCPLECNQELDRSELQQIPKPEIDSEDEEEHSDEDESSADEFPDAPSYGTRPRRKAAEMARHRWSQLMDAFSASGMPF